MKRAPGETKVSTLLRRCDVAGRRCDVRLSRGRVSAVAPRLPVETGDVEIDASGGALLPGLNDHHLHLYATAAALRSVQCGPPHVRSPHELGEALSRAPAEGWVRGVGYHESVAGLLDRTRIDGWVSRRPARVQHRTGALWILNGAAVDALRLDAGVDAPGVERDATGRATGRLYRLDAWLGDRIPREEVSLSDLSLRLARCGIVGVTDAGADNDAARLDSLAKAQRDGSLRQRVLVMGREDLPETGGPELVRGALKLLLDERDLPPLESLTARIRAARTQRRSVAVHAVTRAELWLAIAAFSEAGARASDRIEHASVAPPEAVEAIRRLGLRVVTQPGFVFERGDQYALDVDPADRPWLVRGRGFLAAGIPLAASCDAPYGSPDPWRAMRAAVERRTREGAVLGSAEALSPEEALARFTSPLAAPGDPPARLAPGVRADLCLLREPWSIARTMLSADSVVATWRDGELIWLARDLAHS